MVNRGDIYMADLGEPVGHEQALRRPVLVISAQPWLNSNPPVVTVVPLTRTRREMATHVEVEPGVSGLKEVSYAKCEDIRAISPRRLQREFGHAEDHVMRNIVAIVQRLLGL